MTNSADEEALSTETKKELLAAKQEGEKLARQLTSLQYDLVPDGCAAFGNKATPATLNRAITEGFSILHYTGHGRILDGEEVLMLTDEESGAMGRKVAAPFGRRELRNMSVEKEPDGPFLRGGPLVVLNSCRTGSQRSFGGQREDLTWTLLEEGAEAVIACALPVFDKMGEFFGKHLYTLGLPRSKGMGWQFAHVRALLEEHFRRLDSRLWPAWTLFHYHGNPFAHLPHMPATQQVVDTAPADPDLWSVVQLLKLPGTEEAEALLRDIRGRLA